MRIALHLGTLRGHGSGAVGRGVLRAMVRIAPEHDYLVWVPRQWASSFGIGPGTLGGNVEVRGTPPGIWPKLRVENFDIPRALRAWRADVLLSLTDTSTLRSPVPHVLMVQQAHLAYAPGDLGFAQPLAMRVKWRIMEWYLRAALPGVAQVTVQTQDMRQRLCQRFGVARDRVRVVASAVGAGGSEALPAGRVGGPAFVTFVSSPGHHKNFVVLADMMQALRRQHPHLLCRLTTAAEDVPELVARAEACGVLDTFVFEGRVDHQRAMQLTRDAEVAVMPSKLESFGLPYYEALSTGTAIVCSDLAFAREACGDAALYAIPNRGHDFSAAVLRLLECPETMARQRARATQRFAGLNRGWDEVARDYLGMLQTAASAQRGATTQAEAPCESHS